MEEIYTFPLLDSTNTSSAGNVSKSGFIFSKNPGNINYIVKLEGDKYPATGLIKPRDLQSLKDGKGLIELTKENMMTGPEYHLYYKQQPAGREDGYQKLLSEQQQKSIKYINELELQPKEPRGDSLVAYVTRVNMRRTANGENNLIDNPESVTDPQVLKTALLQEHGLLPKDAVAPPPTRWQNKSQDQLNEEFFKKMNAANKRGSWKSGRRRKTKKSKRRARKTRRRHQ
jgi:hypothetical protein